MSRKRTREFSTSPKFQRVAWAEKRTRRGTVLAAEAHNHFRTAMQTPTRPKKHIPSKQAKFTQDQTPRSGGDIKEAISLPPIPTPAILAPKKIEGERYVKYIHPL
jgi:hypothetical protein